MQQQIATASVKVDGDKLAEALRRVTPFIAGENPPNLACIYAESQAGTLQLTATDGFRMAHLTVALPFPEGNWLMKGKAVKDFAFRHFNGAEVEVTVGEAGSQGTLKLGDVIVELEGTPYVNYPAVVPEEFDVEAIIDTKAWIKPIRHHKAEVVGILYSSAGCRMFLQSKEGETVACESPPVQMFSGPDKKVAYSAEKFRRALTSCGPTATIQVGDPLKATLFEAEDYWHILMPRVGFPKEIALSTVERDAIKWAQEALEAVRKGEVPGIILIGGGKFYLELRPGLTTSEIRAQEPRLAENTAAVEPPKPEAEEVAGDEGQGEDESAS